MPAKTATEAQQFLTSREVKTFVSGLKQSPLVIKGPDKPDKRGRADFWVIADPEIDRVDSAPMLFKLEPFHRTGSKAVVLQPWYLKPIPADQFIPSFEAGAEATAGDVPLFKRLPPAAEPPADDIALTVQLSGCSVVLRADEHGPEIAHVWPGGTGNGVAVRNSLLSSLITRSLSSEQVFGRVSTLEKGPGYVEGEQAEMVGRRFAGGPWILYFQVYRPGPESKVERLYRMNTDPISIERLL